MDGENRTQQKMGWLRKRRKGRVALLLCIIGTAVAVTGIWVHMHAGQVSGGAEVSSSASGPKSFASSKGINPVDKTSWQLMLVNSTHPMPLNYTPAVSEVGNGYQFDTRAAESLKNMLQDARAQGLTPIICSAYRSVQKQTTLFQQEVDKWKAQGLSAKDAEAKAKTVVAYPGTSEHNLGLAADIVAKEYQLLDDHQAETPEAKWLKANCSKYGFILRYPPEKSKFTGVIFEPWHFRYVGKEAAAEIMSRGICLEEYLGQT